jgi:hypothetical protein
MLHNCVAGGEYRQSVIENTMRVLYMQDEQKHRVACISLRPTQDGRWHLHEFQADHDAPLPQKYVSVAQQWLDDHHIDCTNCADYHRFGENIERTVDYHQMEIDETTGRIISQQELKKLQADRTRAAFDVYGADPDGKPNIPPVPEDLLDFDY